MSGEIGIAECFDCGCCPPEANIKRWAVCCPNCGEEVPLPPGPLTREQMIQVWNGSQAEKRYEAQEANR